MFAAAFAKTSKERPRITLDSAAVAILALRLDTREERYYAVVAKVGRVVRLDDN